jgi:hypothetical protein
VTSPSRRTHEAKEVARPTGTTCSTGSLCRWGHNSAAPRAESWRGLRAALAEEVKAGPMMRVAKVSAAMSVYILRLRFADRRRSNQQRGLRFASLLAKEIATGSLYS